jgi:hypothetical protein
VDRVRKILLAATAVALSAAATPALALASSPPTIESESVSNITSTDATLEARINPGGLETTYQFQLVTDPPCLEAKPPCAILQELVTLPSGVLPASSEGQLVKLDVHSAGATLMPGERYEFSVSATNSAGSAQGPPQTFTTLSGQPAGFYENGRLLTTTPVPVVMAGQIALKGSPSGPAEEITCHDIISGSVWNEGGRGVGRLEGLSASECTRFSTAECAKGAECRAYTFQSGEMPLELEYRQAEVCSEASKRELSQCPNPSERSAQTIPVHVRRRAASFPWKMQLVTEERQEEQVSVLEIGVPPAGESCYPKELVEGKPAGAKWEKVPAGCIRVDLIAPSVPVEQVYYGTLRPRVLNGAGNGLDASRLQFNTEAGALTGPWSSQGELRIFGSEASELITAR